MNRVQMLFMKKLTLCVRVLEEENDQKHLLDKIYIQLRGKIMLSHIGINIFSILE